MNTQFVVIQANQNAIAALKWVNRASHKKNPEQMCIYVRGLTIAVTNGFQIHVAIPQIDQPFPEGQWLVRSISGDLVTLERVNTYEPDWRGAIQNYDAQTTLATLPGKVTVTTTIWPALLANSLSLGNLITRMSMTLRGHVAVLEGWLDDEIQLKAYIMLMRTEGEQAILIAPPVTDGA